MSGGSFCAGFVLGHMLDQKLPARLKERQHFVRQCIDRLVGDQAIGIFAPAVRRGQAENENSNRKSKPALSLATHQETNLLNSSVPRSGGPDPLRCSHRRAGCVSGRTHSKNTTRSATIQGIESSW